MKKAIIRKHLQDNIGQNETCINCKNGYNMVTNPLTPYIIADKTTKENDRIMFIGKAARGDSFGTLINEIFEDVTEFGEDFLENSSWAYYSYTRDIIQDYYGDFDTAFKHITFSNMVKCNNETNNDTTPNEAKSCCIDKNKFIWKEVQIIRPRRIIFYTHFYYDDFIEKFRPLNCASIKDITTKENKIKVGKKASLFWHRQFYDMNNNLICSFLRTSHPMLKKKKDFVSSILNWLRSTE